MAVTTPTRPLRWPPAARTSALHWPEYLIEGLCLGLFMLSVCVFGTLFEHPASPVRQQLENASDRRVLMGIAMGLTAILLIYSPIGQRSGAHMNPATTLTFFRLSKIRRTDAIGYIVAQIVGGVVGVQAGALLMRGAVGHPAVNYLPTVPGPDGVVVAFLAEAAISALLMLTVLVVSNRPGIARYTGLCAGFLVMAFIIVEAPLSGMSMNPARSLGSAVAAGAWSDLWLYFVAPPLGMLLAAQVYLWVQGDASILCAKLHHPTSGPCHFNCRLPSPADGSAAR
jgi:aquaporin Z